MAKEAQSFLDAEKTARELVSSLNQLQEEASSYKTAKHELEETRNTLVGLIEATKANAEQVQIGIEKLNEIGAPLIFQQLGRIRMFVLGTLSISLLALIISIISIV